MVLTFRSEFFNSLAAGPLSAPAQLTHKMGRLCKPYRFLCLSRWGNSLRTANVFPVVAFRRETSDDREYVCASQANDGRDTTSNLALGIYHHSMNVFFFYCEHAYEFWLIINPYYFRDNLGTGNRLANLQWRSCKQCQARIPIPISWTHCHSRRTGWAHWS